MASKGKVLVVDDDPMLRTLLVDTLTAIGYESTAASDGVEAMALLREEGHHDFDLVITDIKMPHMDGLTLTKKIRRACPLLPVLFITGVVSEETMAAAAPDGYLSKPFRIELLEDLIEKTLKANRTGKRLPPPRRILIDVAEDELRDRLTETLSLGNYLSFAAAGGDEALEELQRGSFDAIIAGIDTTSAENTERLARLREACPDLPLVLAGAPQAISAAEQASLTLRAAGCISQPIRSEELLTLLDRTLNPDTRHNN
ncbi:MAG: response regulator [Candidatus Zixiibacteriota bacterium]